MRTKQKFYVWFIVSQIGGNCTELKGVYLSETHMEWLVDENGSQHNDMVSDENEDGNEMAMAMAMAIYRCRFDPMQFITSSSSTFPLGAYEQ